MIKKAYKNVFADSTLLPDLIHDFKSELTGITQQLFVGCYQDIGEYDARLIAKAIANDLDKDLLTEIVCTRSVKEIKLMKKAWERVMGKENSMIKEISEVITTNNDFKELVIELLKGERVKNEKPLISNVREMANILFNDMRNEKRWMEVLCTRSWPYIAALTEEFKKLEDNKEGKTLQDGIKEIFGDDTDIEMALNVIIEFSVNPYDYWCGKLKTMMRREKVDKDGLMRIVLGRCEIDMWQIREVFDKKYGDGKILKEWIMSTTSDLYQKMILLLCGYEAEDEEVEDEKKIEKDNLSKIEYKDVASEHIDKLLKMKLPSQLMNPYLLGDIKKYKIPKKKKEYNDLEMDLKRIYYGLKDVNINDDDRKYIKLCMLKYYDLLCLIFSRYCLIGGNKDWLTQKGWNNLCKDLFISDKKSKLCKDKQCQNLFNKILKIHDNKSHYKNKESLWNGIWKKNIKNNNDGNDYDDDNKNNKEQDWEMIFKLKQMSKYKLKGFIRSFNFCDIDGNIKYKETTSNNIDGKSKKFIIFYHDGVNKNKRLKCNAILKDEDTINIEWEIINDGIKTRGDKGSFILKKIGQLSYDDDNTFKSIYGLLRYEFFDSLLTLSQMKFDGISHKYKFQSFLKLIQNFIGEYILDGMDISDNVDIKKFYDEYKFLFKKDMISLQKLFNLYTNNEQLLSKKQWNLLCKDIFEKGIDKTAFKKGGKPNKSDISQSFELAKYKIYNIKLTYNEFQIGLQNLAHKLYKKKPKSKYIKFNYEDKLKKLLFWAVTLQKSGHKPVII